MDTLRIDPAAFSEAELAPAVEALRRGALIAYPTDTLYGLGVDPRSAAAVAAVFEVKGRPGAQPLPLIAADLEQVQTIARLTDPAARLASRFWPGPLTLVLRGTSTLAEGIAASDRTVAVRVPDHAVARALARGLSHPITATSANRSGRAATASPGEVAAALGGSLALLLDAGAAPGGAPSTIVDVTGDPPRLVREGAVAWNRVLESLK